MHENTNISAKLLLVATSTNFGLGSDAFFQIRNLMAKHKFVSADARYTAQAGPALLLWPDVLQLVILA